MSWPWLVRELCEAYQGMHPGIIEDMTLDQIYLLVVNKGSLRRRGRVTGSPQQLAASGVIPPLPGGGMGSYVQRLKAQRAEANAAREKLDKKRRRAERRAALIEYKRRQEDNTDGV